MVEFQAPAALSTSDAIGQEARCAQGQVCTPSQKKIPSPGIEIRPFIPQPLTFETELFLFTYF